MLNFKMESAESIEKQALSAISRSAVVILSTQLNIHLLEYFDTFELILILTCMHTLLSTVKTVPGFSASVSVLKELTQSIVIQLVVNYASSSQTYISVLNLIIVIIILECLPAINGWLGHDLDSFKTNVTYIFADQISKFLLLIHAPLFGAALGICLRGKGLLGQTLAFTGVNTINSVVFESIQGGELSLAWPILLLYFVFELCNSLKGDWEQFFDFGLFKASDTAYRQITFYYKIKPTTLAMLLVFLISFKPKDRVWTGLCVLVLVQSLSEWFLKGISLISETDPVLAGLVVVTVVHFLVLGIDKFYHHSEKVI